MNGNVGHCKHKKMWHFALWALGLSSFLCSAADLRGAESASTPVARLNAPYGICAHVSRGDENLNAASELSRIGEFGISMVRTDFDWSGVEAPQGYWRYEHLDSMLDAAYVQNIQILPILDYSVDWANPVQEHMDFWLDYVTRTVSRYRGQLPYWEVWNEENGGFWNGEQNGKVYADFLTATYRAIKAIDPSLQVLYGGTAGVPMDFIEDSLYADAEFDIMNVHPYHWQETPEAIVPQMKALRKLMDQYGHQEKPIWITEVGWATAQPSSLLTKIFPAALRRCGVEPSEVPLALVVDPEAGFFGAWSYDNELMGAVFAGTHRVKLAEIADLDVERYPVLLPAPSETFPLRYFSALQEYVKRGGTLLLPSGLPFYYDWLPDGKGGYQMVYTAPEHLKQLHIAWDAWWTNPAAPKVESYQEVAEGFEDDFTWHFRPTSRFLSVRNLQEGDDFEPLVLAGNDDFKASVAGIYRLNSDLKGNIIMATLNMSSEMVSEERQANYLPRTYLLALGCGVERVFWYNFRSSEDDPEDRESHFGIARRNLDAKPAGEAYRTLTMLCPDGSTVPELTEWVGGYLASWVRPDGVRMWALWSEKEAYFAKLKISGEILESCNGLGQLCAVTPEYQLLTGQVLYLTGPEQVTVESAEWTDAPHQLDRSRKETR